MFSAIEPSWGQRSGSWVGVEGSPPTDWLGHPMFSVTLTSFTSKTELVGGTVLIQPRGLQARPRVPKLKGLEGDSRAASFYR